MGTRAAARVDPVCGHKADDLGAGADSDAWHFLAVGREGLGDGVVIASSDVGSLRASWLVSRLLCTLGGPANQRARLLEYLLRQDSACDRSTISLCRRVA